MVALEASQFLAETAAAPLWSRAASDSTAVLTADLITTKTGFEALEAEWNDLFRRCARGSLVFQGFNWNWHWANHFQGGDACNSRLAIVCVRAYGAIVGLWPLVVVQHPGLRVIHWMGEPVSQYGDVLIDPAADVARILDFGWRFAIAATRADALHLRKVRDDAIVAPWLAASGATISLRAEAPFLDLATAADFATYEQRYSAKARKNRRRLARRLAGHGDVRVEHLNGGPAARAAALDAVSLKRRTLDDTGRPSLALHDARFAAFFADAAEGGNHPCGCRVTRMMVGETLVASTIDVSAYQHRAAHILVHDPLFASCGPGMLMVEEWARSAHADGMRALDLLAPVHAYKMDWADAAMRVSDFALPISGRGRLFTAYVAHLRPALKDMYERYTLWRARHRHPASAAASD